MDFGIALPTAADSWRVVREAEELGFSHAWFYDTQMLSADCFVAMGAAAGPVENILIARYTPSRYHGLGFGAKFVVAFGASPLAILLISWIRSATGSLDLLFLGLAGTSVVITAVALLLPGERPRSTAIPVPQAAPAE